VIGSFAGAGAAVLWVLLAIRWFDTAAAWRPGWLAALPAAVLALLALALLGAWLWARRDGLRGAALGPDRPGLLLVVGLALLFRLPLAWQGAVGYTSSDGALSGIVALHAREGVAHHVFVPSVAYSGSLKSHLTAALACVIDLPRAFTLCSVLFYLLFVAAVYRLALLAEAPGRRFALPAGLYAAFAPAFVTRYSLSNDGNYVEVLALGTWALWLAARWIGEAEHRRRLALPLGLLLGVAFWCHILAVLHVAAVGLALLLADGRAALRSLAPLAAGAALGYLPGLLWNASHGWESAFYVIPGAASVGQLESGPGLAGRAAGIAFDQAPILMGYDSGYTGVLAALLWGLAWLGVFAALAAAAVAAREARRNSALRVLLMFAAINVVIAALALPRVPGNPRYLVFLAAPIAVLLGRSFGSGPGRVLLGLLLLLGAGGSLAQGPGAARADRRWRSFVADLEVAGVRHCYSDFYQATRVTFLAEERIVCSARLGPSTTEYFHEYTLRVDAAREAALIPVNSTAADKIERRLERLDVRYERRDLVKPVFLGLSRKVTPEELWSARDAQ
jgi:hypothetical protein